MPISSPGTLRSPRKQALSMGTVPSLFTGEALYDSQAGVPAAMAQGHYQDLPPQISTSTTPVDSNTPFALSSGR
jgi:hypothetical protein